MTIIGCQTEYIKLNYNCFLNTPTAAMLLGEKGKSRSIATIFQFVF